MDEQTRLNLEQRLEDVLRRDLGTIPVRPFAMYNRPSRAAAVHPIRRVFSIAGAAAVIAVVILVALAAAFALRELKPTPATVPVSSSSPSPSSAASAQPSATAAVAIPTPVAAGAITGRFSYGSDFLPAVTVYAISTTDPRVWYAVDFPGLGQPPRPTPQPGTSGATYTITGVAPGTYWVVAYRKDGQFPDPGYYSQGAICVRTTPSGPCPDLRPIPATVIAGQTTSGIDILTWGPPPGQPSPTIPPRPTPRPVAVVSTDRKSVSDGQIVLAIDNDQIVEWFRTQSQLCDGNINSTPDRRSFCTDKATFRDRTHFVSAVPTPDGMTIGFTIGSDTLAPDAVAGIYQRSTGAVRFLTSYYLGNQFISFSPSGANFIYQGGCYEAKCGLFIRDTVTLVERARLNELVGGERRQNATFVRWVSDNEVEYRLGPELKRVNF
jgi:hypothetical protein